MHPYLSILESCALFDGIEPAHISAMLTCLGAKEEKYDKHAPILMEGDPARQMGIVLSGSVQIVKNDFYGNRSIVTTIRPAQLFGETFACAEVDAIPVSAIAMEKSEILLIDCRRISRVCSNACGFHGRMILNLMRVMAAKNLVLNQKIDIISKRTTREKLLAYLMEQARQCRSAEFTIPFDRQALADYLGVERSALSAEISKLRSEGILESTRSWFKLCSPL